MNYKEHKHLSKITDDYIKSLPLRARVVAVVFLIFILLSGTYFIYGVITAIKYFLGK